MPTSGGCNGRIVLVGADSLWRVLRVQRDQPFRQTLDVGAVCGGEEGARAEAGGGGHGVVAVAGRAERVAGRVAAMGTLVDCGVSGGRDAADAQLLDGERRDAAHGRNDEFSEERRATGRGAGAAAAGGDAALAV